MADRSDQISTLEDRYKGESGNFESIATEEGSGPSRSIEGWLIFVTGINEEAQEDDINEAFSQFGNIKNLHVNLDRRTGYVKGYALVEYEKFDEARSAVEEMNGGEILGKAVKVDWAFKKPPKGTKSGKKK